jgi:LssY C-terminus
LLLILAQTFNALEAFQSTSASQSQSRNHPAPATSLKLLNPAAHLLKVMMLSCPDRMARPMQTVRSPFDGAIVFIGALASFSCSLLPVPSPAGRPSIEQLAVLQTTKSDQPLTAAPGVPKRLSKTFTLRGDSDWIDTGIDVAPGEHVVATAKGSMRYSSAKTDNGPDGLTRGFKDLLRILPFNAAGRGALIGRVGDADVAQPFLLGASNDVTVPVGGRLSIAINESKTDTGDGSYTVRIDILAADTDSLATFAVARTVTALPGIDDLLFEKIARRINDQAGNPGDMVNFLILGSETDMQNVFTAAGWVKVDSDLQNTILHGLISSLSKESYLTMPMSQLYLFGRSQDYGWAHAEPIDVVRSRHHLRIWKAPFSPLGETLWVGAATHDIGFERDERNNGLTHKIDPDVDLERDYLEKTLCGTGLVTQVSHFLPRNPMRMANTATGGSFHSNGQVLILKLAENKKEPSAAHF